MNPSQEPAPPHRPDPTAPPAPGDTARPAPAGAVHADPTDAGPAAAEPTAAEPTAAGPTAAGPTGAGPTDGDRTGAGPATSEPTDASPAAAGPTGAGTTGAGTTGAESIGAEPTGAGTTGAESTGAGPTGAGAGPAGAGSTGATPADAGPADAGAADAGPAGAGEPAPSPWAAGFQGDAGYGLADPTGPGEPYDPAAHGYPDPWEESRPSRRPWRRTALVAVLTGVAVLILGGPLGLLWHWLAPSVPVLDAGSNGIVVNDPSPEEYIAADGWYTLLALGFGLVVAVVAWQVMRKDRGPFLLLGVVLGTFGAGYLVGPWIGGLVGRGGYHHWQETAVQGATYLAPPQVHSVGPRLVAAFAAAIVLTLLAGWSNDPDLDAPGAKPGHGANQLSEI